MKLGVMLIWVFFVGSTGQTAQMIISDDMDGYHGWNNHAFFDNAIGDTQQTAINSDSVIANSCLYVCDKVLTWIKDTYRVWVSKDNYGSSRLLLLSIGLVGILGIRRRFKKSRSTQYSGEKKKFGS